ncbi:hypothetical protein FOXYSP1_19719 [Fusarium oxysporum f. sp. phaseoli]
MLESLWDALMENQNKATKVIRDQLETFRRLKQEIRLIRTEAADDRKKTEQLRLMLEQMNEQLGQARQQTAEEMRQLREQLDVMTISVTANSAQASPQPSYADVARTPPAITRNKKTILSYDEGLSGQEERFYKLELSQGPYGRAPPFSRWI